MRKEESRKAKKEQEGLERRRQRRTEILPPKKKKSQRKKERRRRFWHIMVSYWVYHIAQLRSSSQNRVWNNKLKRKHQESLEMETTFRGASNTPGTRRTKFIVATIHRYFVGSTRTWKLVLSENMLYFQVMACSDFRSTKLYIYMWNWYYINPRICENAGFIGSTHIMAPNPRHGSEAFSSTATNLGGGLSMAKPTVKMMQQKLRSKTPSGNLT